MKCAILSLLILGTLSQASALSDERNSSSQASTCQALAIGGGGDRIAFTAGAMKYLASQGAQWQVVSSVSASLLAASAAVYNVGDEEALANFVVAQVSNLSQASIFKQWPSGIKAAYDQKTGLYDTTPLQNQITSIISAGIKDRIVSVSATSLNSGKLESWKQDSDAFNSGLMASDALPGYFPAIVIGDDAYVDGSVRMGVNLFEAVNLCRQQGFDDAQIIVDTVMTVGDTLAEVDPSSYKTAAVNDRNTDIKNYDAIMNDIGWAKDAYPSVQWRYLIMPSSALSANMTTYDAQTIANMISQGQTDAESAFKRMRSKKECAYKSASKKKSISCSQDRDCFNWAVSNCLDNSISLGARCMKSNRGATGMTCSFRRAPKGKTLTSHRTDKSGSGPSCLAAAVSGGGDRGAYEAGLVKGLVEGLDAQQVEWQVATGISVGSVLSTGMGLFAIGNESAMSDFLVETALSITKKAIYKDWFPLGIVTGLASKTGLYDSSPERSFLTSIIENGGGFKGRRLTVGATDLDNGRLVTWNNTVKYSTAEYVDHLMCSSAIPGVLPMQNVDGQWFSDGGTKMGVDVFNAVVQCRDMGAKDADITVDILLCAGLTLEANNTANFTVEDVRNRVTEIQTFDDLMDTVGWAKIAYPDVNWRFTIQPSTTLPGTAMDFDPSQMKEMVGIGEKDAASAIASMGSECKWQTADVPCTIDKDCYNWGVSKCSKPLTTSFCKQNRRCMFKL